MDLKKIDNASVVLSSIQMALGVFFLIKIILLYMKNKALSKRHFCSRDRCNNGRWTLSAIINYIAYNM